MRISYQEGKLYLSLRDAEVQYIYNNKHTAVEIDIKHLKVLHADIALAVSQYLREKDDRYK